MSSEGYPSLNGNSQTPNYENANLQSANPQTANTQQNLNEKALAAKDAVLNSESGSSRKGQAAVSARWKLSREGDVFITIARLLTRFRTVPPQRPDLLTEKMLTHADASSAYNSVANHPVTQNLTQGPAAQAVYDEKDKTANEFRNVLDSRVVPEQTTATGQPLTHYHSMFFNILSWKNPRVTTISYASIITFIFFTRYVPVLKYIFKGLYVVLGITAAAEVAGKVVLDRGLASHMRPRKYYTINRQSLDAVSDDVEQFINFFVIEFQRIVFAENVYATIAAFTSALLGYLLVKIVPTWGLALIATSLIYFVPLIYIKNQKVIDQHLSHAGEVINQQATQVRDLAAHHTNRATEVAKNTASEYSTKAQELIGQGKNRASSPSAPNPANLNPYKNEPERNVTKEDTPNPANLNPYKNEPEREVTKEDLPNPANLNPYKNEPEREFTQADFPSAPSQLRENFPSAPSTEPTHRETNFTPIPDTAATIPENNSAEVARAEEVDGIMPEALAS